MSIPPKEQDPFLLCENDVVERVAAWFEKEGCKIEAKSTGNSPGVDLIAFNKITEERFFVEAKGNIKNNSDGKGNRTASGGEGLDPTCRLHFPRSSPN